MASRPVRKLILPAIVFAAFWALGVTAWRVSGYVQPLALFGNIGPSLGLGLGLYALLPKKKQQRAHRLTVVLVG